MVQVARSVQTAFIDGTLLAIESSAREGSTEAAFVTGIIPD